MELYDLVNEPLEKCKSVEFEIDNQTTSETYLGVYRDEQEKKILEWETINRVETNLM